MIPSFCCGVAHFHLNCTHAVNRASRSNDICGSALDKDIWCTAFFKSLRWGASLLSHDLRSDLELTDDRLVDIGRFIGIVTSLRVSVAFQAELRVNLESFIAVVDQHCKFSTSSELVQCGVVPYLDFINIRANPVIGSKLLGNRWLTLHERAILLIALDGAYPSDGLLAVFIGRDLVELDSEELLGLRILY